MGFFQDLKEDLSIAVDELAGEGAGEETGSAADAAKQMEESLAAINEAGKEVAQAAKAERLKKSHRRRKKRRQKRSLPMIWM